jgi:hypothetical protein
MSKILIIQCEVPDSFTLDDFPDHANKVMKAMNHVWYSMKTADVDVKIEDKV